MKKFISAVVSFCLLSALVGCNPDSDHQKKSRNNMAQREQSEISEDVSKLLSDLVVLESQNPQKSSGILKNCEKEVKKFKQIICAIMRKLVHIIFGVLKYDVPKFKIAA